MQTKISSKGQVVLPSGVRKRLGPRPGESLDVSIEADRVVLSRSAPAPSKVRIATDARTGLPMLAASKDAPKLTSAQVAEVLADFP
jgi:AbrB family looped-hinge helix DNA binding protein